MGGAHSGMIAISLHYAAVIMTFIGENTCASNCTHAFFSFKGTSSTLNTYRNVDILCLCITILEKCNLTNHGTQRFNPNIINHCQTSSKPAYYLYSGSIYLVLLIRMLSQ